MPWGRGSTRESRKTRARVLRRDGYQCQIRGPHCTGEATEDDHIVPVWQGGDDDLTNRRAACHTCHDEKSRREAVDARRTNKINIKRVARHPSEGGG